MRCFVAVDLTRPLRQPLIKLLDELPRSRDVRWCTQHQLHVTLKFLGDVPDAQIAQVKDAVGTAAAQLAPFKIKLGELGCFPSPRNPRVFWCGITDPSAGCARWVQTADPLFADLGFEPETRAYTPHITLGRSKSSAGSEVLRDALQNTAAPPTTEMTVESVVLFESRLLPQGARYIPLATVPFTLETPE
ncbi:MAG: RNA 2',3'-cyclic phosphodiesterase [Planctomycetota bacterium]